MLRRAELASLVVTVTAEHALEWINRSGPGLIYYSQKWPPSDVNFGFLAQSQATLALYAYLYTTYGSVGSSSGYNCCLLLERNNNRRLASLSSDAR
jgi:hypothetical protein